MIQEAIIKIQIIDKSEIIITVEGEEGEDANLIANDLVKLAHNPEIDSYLNRYAYLITNHH